MSFYSLFFASALMALATAKNPILILYEHANSNGASRTIVAPTNDFVDFSFNDVVSSVAAVSGDWEMYQNAWYTGSRMFITEGQRTDVSKNDYYSSARPVCKYQADPTTSLLKAFEHANQQGESQEYLVDVADLEDWHDRISSVVALKGDWELYQHTNFEGARRVVQEGQQINLSWGNDIFSSLRPLCETYTQNRKCVLKKIVVVDNGEMEPEYSGTQIIGSAESGTCYGPGSSTISLSSADSVEESFSLEIGETEEVNWSASVEVTVSADAKFLGAGGSVSVGVSVGVGGSHSVSTSETKSNSAASEQVVGKGYEFATPGAGIVFGTVDRFTVDKADVPVKMHMECPDGDDYVKDSTMKMQSTKFQSAHFWPLSGTFNAAACKADRNLPECVGDVKRRYSHFLGKKDEIRADFDLCFADGKGSTGL